MFASPDTPCRVMFPRYAAATVGQGPHINHEEVRGVWLSATGRVLAYEIVHGDHLFGGRAQYSPEAQADSETEFERGKEQAQHVRPVM
jgi:hypothetical protein